MTMLWFVGCGFSITPVSPPASAPVVAPVPSASAVPTDPNRPAWCVDAPADPVWKLVQPDDLLPELLKAVTGPNAQHPPFPCAAIQGDFDKNGKADLALFERSGRDSRLRLVMDNQQSLIVRTWAPPPSGPPVYSFLFFKPSGEQIFREYLPPAGARLKDRDVLEVCMPTRVDSSGMPAPFSASNLCGCSDFVWVEGGKLESLRACD